MPRYFTEEHEWIDVTGQTATIGITDYAQEQLGDVVFVDVPVAGAQLVKGKEAAVVESVKAASDVFAPVSGAVTEGNSALEDDPALVNTSPEGDGWFFKLKGVSKDEFAKLQGRIRANERLCAVCAVKRFALDAYFDDDFVKTPVYDRRTLTAGQTVDGPAIVEQSDTTLSIHPGQRAHVRGDRSILVDLRHA